MLIQTTVRLHFIALRVAKIKKIVAAQNAGQDSEKRDHAYVTAEDIKRVRPFWKTV